VERLASFTDFCSRADGFASQKQSTIGSVGVTLAVAMALRRFGPSAAR
jgi:hypothetical protein